MPCFRRTVGLSREEKRSASRKDAQTIHGEAAMVQKFGTEKLLWLLALGAAVPGVVYPALYIQ
jgi:hypothetical protein